MKTITIRDEVYRKLVSLKGKGSFSDVIDDLIKRDVERRVTKIIEVSSEAGYSKELEEVVKRIREGLRARL